MEQVSTPSSLFSLSIDPVTKAHLTETAKWARFLAIIGFVFLGLGLVVGIISMAAMSYVANDVSTTGFGSFASFGIAGFIFGYILVVLLVFFPLLFLLRFANQMKAALVSNDQQKLNVSFQNLKAYFRFWGILAIIALAFYAIAFAFGIFGTILSR
jgi:hypothetical protein